MIEAEVQRNDEVIMRRTYSEPGITPEFVIKQLEMYVINERLNVNGECLLRARSV